MYGPLMTPEQRVEAFRRMVEQRPDEPFARYSLAMSLRAAGRGEDAAREFEELARRKPAYVPTYLMLGQVLEALGRAADAAAAYERGVVMGKRGRPLVEPFAKAVLDCDVSRDEEIDRAAQDLGRVWDRLDVLVHSIAYAPREAMSGRFTDVTTRDSWRVALEVSAYSLIGLARAFKPMMKPGSAIITISYYGAEKVV